MKQLKAILAAYRQLLGILWREAPTMVAATFLAAIVQGLIAPLVVYANQHVFDDGLLVAQGELAFSAYVPYLVLLAATMIIPQLMDSIFIYGYVEPKSQLILQTSYKGEMLKKLNRSKYEHFENPGDVKTINCAVSRAMSSARHMFPMYIYLTISSLVSAVGLLLQVGAVRLWLPAILLAGFAVEMYHTFKHSRNIYDELESYWTREREYKTLAGFLKSRDYLYEGKLNASAEYLTDTYRRRLHARNHEYEQFYFKHLKDVLLNRNVFPITALICAALLIGLYIQGTLSVGLLISLTLMILTQLGTALLGSTVIFMGAPYHIKFLDYYNKLFAFSEDKLADPTPGGAIQPDPDQFDIEFRDVWFKYPGNAESPWILSGLSLRINQGEKISIVGENGAGKSTMIKLLLGLFEPTKGEILLDGKPIDSYTRAQRNRVFAPVFQDFIRYSFSLRENIAVGDVELLHDETAILAAARKGGAADIADMEQALGRDFEGGRDISGGQWQRIAISRAFMGDKPVLLLDEPTSQLDPLAESNLYEEFHKLASGKSAIFITHRLASTMITDRILVLADGKVAEEGDHAGLMAQCGIYAEMFEAQRKWYKRASDEEVLA